LAQISTSVDRTARLVRQLIDLASVDSADRGGDAENVRLDRVINDLRADMEGLSSRRSVSMETFYQTDELPLVRNANLLRLALRNVVENAVQYSPERSSVSIILQQAASRFEIEVIDQGSGIDPTDQDEVRERFKRGSSTTVDGSGLGLAIVDMAMNKLGGELGFHKMGKGVHGHTCIAAHVTGDRRGRLS